MFCLLQKSKKQNFNEHRLVELFNRETERPPFNPVRVHELTLGRKYNILCIRTICTKYGVKPICDLDSGESIYLPTKYCKALPRDDGTANSHYQIDIKNTTLVYMGHEKDKWRTPILKFHTEDDVDTCDNNNNNTGAAASYVNIPSIFRKQ